MKDLETKNVVKPTTLEKSEKSVKMTNNKGDGKPKYYQVEYDNGKVVKSSPVY